MNKEQAKEWFRNIIKGCYFKKLDKHPDSIFWVYDKNLIRQKKLAKITGIEKYNLNKFNGEWIFKQNEKSNIFSIKYNNYWSFLKSKFNLDDYEIQTLTTEVVNKIIKHDKYKSYITSKGLHPDENLWSEILNSNQYTIIR